MKKTLVYIKNDLIDSKSNIYLRVCSLTKINNIIIVSNNNTFDCMSCHVRISE